jgi:PAS domain S-box-containing protein
LPPTDSLDDGFLFRALLDTMPDSVYVKDRDARLLRVSQSMVRNLGLTDRGDLVGKSDVDLFGADFGHRTYIEDLRVMETDEPIAGLIESRLLEDSGQNWTLTTKLPVHDEAGNVIGLFGITREINELKQAEMSLQYLATHDTLTALPNRFLMMDRLNQVLARAGGTRRHVACSSSISTISRRSTTRPATKPAMARFARSRSACSPACVRATPSPGWAATNS